MTVTKIILKGKDKDYPWDVYEVYPGSEPGADVKLLYVDSYAYKKHALIDHPGILDGTNPVRDR